METFSRWAGVAVAVLGATVLAGWILGIPQLTWLHPSFDAMRPATAVSFALTGISLRLLARGGGRGAVVAARALTGLSLAANAVFLVEWVAEGAFGIEGLLGTGLVRSAPTTVVSFLAIGVSLELLAKDRAPRLAQAMAVAGGVAPVLTFLAFAYGVKGLVDSGLNLRMAFHSSLAFVLLALGALAARGDRGIASVTADRGVAGVALRRLVPAILVTTLAGGWIVVACSRAGIFGAEFAAALVAFLATLAGVGSVLWTARELRRGEEGMILQLRRLDLMNRVTRAIVERQDTESIFGAVLGHLLEQADMAAFLKVGADGSATVTSVRNVESTLGLRPGTRADPGDEVLRRLREDHTVYEADLGRARGDLLRALDEAGMRSAAALPLAVRGDLAGILVVARRDPAAFSSADCAFLHQLAEHVALALHQVRLAEEVRRAYEELRATQQLAMQQERLRAMGQMASGIAHDINNALAPVTIYSESMLESPAGLDEKGRRQLKTILAASESIATTVARMREFYRKRDEQAPFGTVRLDAIARQVLELTRPRWHDIPLQRGAKVAVETAFEEGLPEIQAVEAEIRDAITNLVINAVDAMPEGGTLTVAARRLGERVAIEVRDTGVGMDEATRQRCLEPFFTTKGERGTGLGLAMVYGAVQRHEGSIEIESSPGRGTTMRLLLPVKSREVAAATEAVAAAPVAPMRLLFIDDDPLLRESVRDMLELDGHQVELADGGKAGIERFRQALASGRGFHAVITDQGMPLVTGRDVAKAVRDMSPGTSVILLTGWGTQSREEAGVAGLVDEVLSKPPRLARMREALARARSRSGGRNP
jgi:signal transduction histidine kinase/ActR/RegA family two-component response regulator